MNILLLRGFNNYANRIVVRYETLNDYTKRSKASFTYSDVNFNSNDGVTTELVVGGETQQIIEGQTSVPLDWEKSGHPDYLVCFETSEESGEPPVSIISRWFVLESQRTRNGQYKIVLKRDTIADHLTEVEEATCFVEKGIVEDIADPVIYNKENITTNQIKSDEFLLRDETQCPWIVGYVAKNRTETDSNGSMHLVDTTFIEPDIPGPQASDSAASEVYADESAFWAAHPELIGTLATLNSWQATVKLDVYYGKLFTHYRTGQTIHYFNNGNVSWEESAYDNDLYLHSVEQDGYYKMNWKWWTDDWRETLCNNFIAGWKTDAWRNGILNQIAAGEAVNFVSDSTIKAFDNYIQKPPIVKIGSKFYRPYNLYAGNSTVANQHYISIGSTAYDLFYSGLDLTPAGEAEGSHDLIEGTPGPQTFQIEYSIEKRALGFQEIFSKCKAKKPATIPELKDAPYYMFAIPYSNDLGLFKNNNPYCKTNKSVAMNAAQAMAQKAGVGVVYDVQLLPYCPIRDIIKTTKVSAHAEITDPTVDYFIGNIGGAPLNQYIQVPVAKVNHQYVVAKDITFTSETRTAGIRSHIITGTPDTASPLKVRIGTDLEHPTEFYDAYEILVVPTDLQDYTSTPVIKIYKSISSVQSNTPDVVLDYATYASGSSWIGFEATDSCEYSYTVVMYPSGTIYLGFTYIPSGGEQGGRMRVGISFKTLVKDYIYYEDYYMTRLDIANVITSDIVTVVDNVETDVVNVIFWCTDSQFTFNKYLDNYFLRQIDGSYKQDAITHLINEKVKLPYDIKEMKVRGQTDMVRLASPNYSNFFDINVVQNRGIEFINVDCTYKPYQPYLHLNPNFKGLYGADYNDVRGLICGGDYSIATTTDAWATYQLQNKNYQSIFDRQMQQLQVVHDVQRTSEVANAIAGVGVGAVGGALTGAKAGPYGAIAGAVIGGGASAIGGMADLSNSQRLREIQVSTMKDVHYMQLDNIKALPLGLAKTSYLTNNNKLFPFLEFYTCTSAEDMAVRNYLNYNGMTINRFGKIRDYQSSESLPYIKAQLIRINLQDDAHLARDIADELKMGIYIPEGDSEEESGGSN